MTNDDFIKKDVLKKLKDPKFYLENFTKIKGKEGGLVPFILNEAQKDFLNTMRKNSRSITLKARQIGFSSLVSGYLYHRTITTPGVNTALIGYNADLTAELLDKVKTFYRTTPDELKPKIQYNSKYEISFPAIDSKIIVLPSSENVGRGYTLHNVLCVSGENVVYGENGRNIKVKDLVGGEKIIDGNGKYSVVKRTIKREAKDKKMVNVSTLYNTSIELTEDHKIFVMGEEGFNGCGVWKESRELNKDDFVAYPIKEITNNIKYLDIPKIPPLTRGGNTFFTKMETIPISKELGELLGWYIAEGSINNNRVCFSVDENEVDEVVSLIEKVFSGLYKNSPRINKRKDSRSVVIEINSRVLSLFIKSLLESKNTEFLL